MAISPSIGCVHYIACYEGKNYIKFPTQDGNPAQAFEILDDGTNLPVTDQAIIDGIKPNGCQVWQYVIKDPSIHFDGAPLQGTGTTADPFQIPVSPDDIDTTTVKYVEGDTLTYDVTLADGTVIAAGTALPAGVCVLSEEDEDGNPIRTKVYEATDLNNLTELYVGDNGDTNTTTTAITLSDGTVINPGDPIPPGTVVFIEYDTNGVVIDQDDFASGDDSCHCTFQYVIKDPAVHVPGAPAIGNGNDVPFQIPVSPDDIDTLTRKYIAGDVLTYPVTLGDGTVIAAGDPLPAGVCVVSEEAADGTPIETKIFEVSDSNNTTELLVGDLGDTATQTITLSDGTVLNPGDPIPAGVVVFLELDSSGGIIDQDDFTTGGSGCQCDFVYTSLDATHVVGQPAIGDGETAPVQIPIPDICGFLGALEPADCADGPFDLVTADCTVISSDDVAPVHTLGFCSSPGETITPVAGPTPATFTSNFLESGQRGEIVLTGDCANTSVGIAPGTFPLTLNAPAATPGCVVFLHLSYGASWNCDFSQHTPFQGITVTPSGTDLANQTLVGSQGITPGLPQFPNDDEAGQTVYAYDAVTGGTGSTVTIDFAQWPDNTVVDDGVFTYHWVEVCEPGMTLTVNDFDIANAQTVTAEPPPGPATTGENVSTSAEFDLGECPAVVFAVGRHVASNPNDPSATDTTFETPDATNWFDVTGVAGVTEFYDENSYNSFYSCQMGWAAAFVDGGTGPWGYDFIGNQGSFRMFDPVSAAIGIPLKECTNDAPASLVGDTSCEVEVCNDNCGQQGLVRCSVTASVKINAPAGTKVAAMPVIDGANIANQKVEIDNTNGTEDRCETFAVSFSITDAATSLSFEECKTTTFAWYAENTGTGDVTVSDYETECEIIHV